jgi:H/ACA ribonucleoprotein complex subunit 2
MSEAESMEVEKKKKKKDKKRDTASITSPTSSAELPPASTAEDGAEVEGEAVVPAGLSLIAHPLAPRRLTKKLLKLVKKASKTKSLRRGVKEVVKAIRKGEKGSTTHGRAEPPLTHPASPAHLRSPCGMCGLCVRLMIIAGNITPIDVITHLPVLCEESEVPYIFVPAKEELGSAGSTKRPTSCVLVQASKGSDHEEYYEEVRNEVLKINPLVG